MKDTPRNAAIVLFAILVGYAAGFGHGCRYTRDTAPTKCECYCAESKPDGRSDCGSRSNPRSTLKWEYSDPVIVPEREVVDEYL